MIPFNTASLPPSSLFLPFGHLTVRGTTSLILVAAEREGGLALRLGHLAGQVDEGFDERAPVHDRHLPQADLLVLRPVLGHVRVDSPFVLLVQLVTEYNNGHLFLVSVTVYVLFECLHSFEGLFTVDAVNEYEAVCERVVVSRELHPVTESAGVIEAHLLPCATVGLHGADVDVLQRLHGL